MDDNDDDCESDDDSVGQGRNESQKEDNSSLSTSQNGIYFMFITLKKYLTIRNCLRCQIIKMIFSWERIIV